MSPARNPGRTKILCACVLGLAAEGWRSTVTVAEAQSTGLVAAYGFNEGAGATIADASGNGRTGAISGATWTGSGKFGSALRFNGTNAVVTVNHAASLNLTTGMTLEAWVMPAVTPSGWRTVMHKNTDRYYLMAGSDGNAPAVGGTFANGNRNTYGTAALAVNTWTHLAATFDGITVRLFVNGVQVRSAPQTAALTASNGTLQIGGDVYGENFNGTLDEIRIYNRALSLAQIQADMQTAVAPPAPDLTPPTAPSNLAVTTPTATQASLAWTASTDDRGVTGYQVERCTGGGCGAFALTASPATASHVDNTLAAGTTYSYRVRATDAAGNFSGYSNTATVTTPSPDLTPPTAPANVVASATGPGQITASWTAATDNLAVTGYRVDRCQGAGCTNFSQVATATGTSYANSGLAAGTTYGYRVAAVDGAGNTSSYSNTAYATTGSQVAGLVAAYSFNAGAGTLAADESGGGNSGTISGASWTTSGKFGSALVFNGSSATVTLPDGASLDLSAQMTLEAWVRPAVAPSGWRTVLHKNTDRYYLMAGSDRGTPAAGGTFASGNQNTYGTAPLAVNTWTHLAASFDGTTVRLYADGLPVGSQPQTAALTTSTGTLQIGGDAYGEYFNGTLDEIRIYNRALSQAEIQADMATPVGTPRLLIHQPAAGSTITSGSVAVNYSAAGDLTAVDHAHFQLDSDPVVMDMDFDGTYVYGNVAVGSHTLHGWLVRADHSTIGNTDATVSFSTTVPDTSNPTVTLTAPQSGAVVSGVITLSADASDNVGIAGVQFKLDGANAGAEVTSPAYSVFLNTATLSNGPHDVTATARDLAGNTTATEQVPITVSNTDPNDPAQIGAWSAVHDWPIVAIHASLMPNGKVLAWDDALGPTGVEIWDPATNTFSSVPYTAANLFCAGLTTLADGRPILVGGHAEAYVGIADTTLFDPVTQSLIPVAPMTYDRWYPTTTLLPDGRVLSVSGAISCPSCASPGTNQPGIATIPEIYDPVTDTWVQLPAAALSLALYPHMFVLPDGRVLAASTMHDPIVSKVLDLTTHTWTTVDPSLRDGGSTAMFLPGKLVKSGSARNPDYPPANSAATTFVLDMAQPSPLWRQTASMAFRRTQHTLTMLPDGTVLATGGSGTSDVFNLAPAVLEAELWSPGTETWRTLSRMATPRVYHSLALLLPDARVLVAGGGRFGIDQLTAEIYTPPYLFKGARPSIVSAPAVVQHGAGFFVQTPDAARIASASMIRLGSVTHAINMGQVFVPASFSVVAGGLTVQAPANANIAPPGYYMLFLVDTNGVPSLASLIRIPTPGEDLQPPSTPSSLTASGGVGAVTLNWQPATDNVGVTAYAIHRGTTAGVTPQAANRIGRVTPTAYSDRAVTTGTYYYVVTAEDAGGNTSAASNEASASVTADTNAPSVAITAPAAGATLSGTVTITASATDDVAVAGVQMLIDGNPYGIEDTTAPYSVNWDTIPLPNGPHTVSARARDSAGNSAVALDIQITISNAQPSGLVAAYAFNEGSGATVADVSGNNNTGVVSGGGAWSTQGRFGGALSFNGTSAVVTVNSSSSLNLTTAMTLEAWVNPAVPLSNWTAVMHKNVDRYYLMACSDQPGPAAGATFTSGNQNTYAPSPLPTNTWTHLAATFDGTTVRLYVNGVQVRSQPQSTPLTTSTNTLQIGADAYGEYFNGRLDEIRIYNRALTPAQIQADMQAPVGGS